MISFQVKLDIISARNNEVERLNEALETVFPYSQYDKKPEDRYKSISKKINNDDRNSTNHQHHYSLTEKSE